MLTTPFHFHRFTPPAKSDWVLLLERK